MDKDTDLFSLIPALGATEATPELAQIRNSSFQGFLLDAGSGFTDENPEHRKSLGSHRDWVDLYAIGRILRDAGFANTSQSEDQDPIARAAKLWKEVETKASEIFSGVAENNPGWTAKDGFIEDLKNYQQFETEQIQYYRNQLLSLQRSMTLLYRFMDEVVIGKYEEISLEPTLLRTARNQQTLVKTASKILKSHLVPLVRLDAGASFLLMSLNLTLAFRTELTILDGIFN